MSFLRRQRASPLPHQTSPIVPGGGVVLVDSIDSDELVDVWKRWADIDISDRFAHPTAFDLVQCQTTGLEYTLTTHGEHDATLFEELRAVERRVHGPPWEHTWALRDLEGQRRLLIVENGADSIVREARAAGFNAQGTSHSATITTSAQRCGLPIEHLAVAEASAIYPATFDAIAAFEVLDRTLDPGRLLDQLIAMVKPGGEIVVSVNHADSDIDRRDDAILLPPLSFCRWSEDTFRRLPDHLPVELESLAVGQIGNESSGVHRSRFKSQFDLTEALSIEFPAASSRSLTRLALRRFSSGQRLYARLRRVTGEDVPLAID